MPDPADQLARFDPEPDFRPPPVAEVRRRGDRIRRRRQALVAGASLVGAVAIAAPIFIFSSGAHSTRPAPATSSGSTQASQAPTSRHQDLTTLKVDHLLRATDIATDARLPDRNWPWVDTATTPGEGSQPVSQCFDQSLADLGAQEAYRRDFERETTAPLAKSYSLETLVGQFSSSRAAADAFDALERSALDCTPGAAKDAKTAEMSDDSALITHTAAKGQAIHHLGVVREGNRLVIAALHYAAPSDIELEAFNNTLMSAATRLVGDGNEPNPRANTGSTPGGA